jgi:hypothetical protein
MEAREIAREFIISYFNIRGDFFDTAWDFVNANFGKISSLASSSQGIKNIGGPLAFGGDEEQGAVKAILIFADGFREMPLKSDMSDFVDSVRTACGKYHAEARLTEEILKKVTSLENRIAKFMRPEVKGKLIAKEKEQELEGYVIYLPTSSGIGTDISGISEKKIREEYLQKKNDYDVFVYTRNVFVKSGREMKSLQMDERIYRMLVIFLRQKDMLVPTIPLYRKAWVEAPLKITAIRDDSDVAPYLKSSISELRSILTNVPNFEITKARFQGYICKGKFKFCAIILKSEEKKYILSEAEEPEDHTL